MLAHENPEGALAYGTALLHGYTIGEFLYTDGEGILYEGIQEGSAQSVYIKEYFPITLSEDRIADGTIRPKNGSEVMFKTTRMDFADLYWAVQNITPTTGLVTVVEVFELHNTVYVVLENVGGVPLAQYINDVKGLWSVEDACSLLATIFTGVETMHRAGLVHRGISPENIIVLPDGTARLAGYATIGLRTAGGKLRSQLYEGYAAPEQYSTADFEGRYTDTYGIAAVFYLLVTGQAPVSAGQRLVSDANPTARSLVPTLPVYISDILRYGLRMKPNERIQTVRALQKYLGSPEAARAFLIEQKRARKKNHHVKNILAAILIGSAMLFCMFFWWLTSRSANVPQPTPTPEPSPTATPEPVDVTVDNFVGLPYAQVQTNKKYTDGYLFYITEAYHTTVPAGTIISQTPLAGEVFEAQTRVVELIVSKGPELVVVPSLFGFTQDGAAAELVEMGLTPSFVMQLNDGSYASGCVVKTDPAAEKEVQTGTVITVYIAADRDVEVIATPEPEPTPSPEPSPSAAPETE